MGEIEKTCYLCFEECNDLSRCNCKNVYLHLKCQKEIIDRSNDYKCTICKKEYTNIVYSNVIDVHDYECKQVMSFLLCFTFLFFSCLAELLVGLYIIKDFEMNYTIILYICVTTITTIFLLYAKIRLIVYLLEICNNQVRTVDLITHI